MPADARGDDVYQPQDDEGGDPPNDELDLENTLDERDLDDRMEEGYSPPDRPLAVNRFGTTGAEVRHGESLDHRLAQETDDVEPPGGDGIGDLAEGEGEPLGRAGREPRAGRLSAADDTAGRENDVDRGKPSPEPVQLACRLAGVGAGRAVFVGDTVWDMEAAARAGVTAVALLSGGIPRADLERAGAEAVYQDVADPLDRLDDSPFGPGPG